MNITYTIDSKLYPVFASLGFSQEVFDRAIADGMRYFTHIWDNTVSRVSRNGRVAFLLMPPGSGPGKGTDWGYASGRNCFINPFPGKDRNNPHKWSISALNHIAHHEAGHVLVYNRHWNLSNYYNDVLFSHVLSLRGMDFFGAFSPYEHWWRRSWGIKRSEAWHPFVHTWLRMSPQQQSANRSLLMRIVGPYYQLGRNSNSRLHSLIGAADVDNELRSLSYQNTPLIPIVNNRMMSVFDVEESTCSECRLTYLENR